MGQAQEPEGVYFVQDAGSQPPAPLPSIKQQVTL